MAKNLADATAYVRGRCAPSVYPTLTDPEIQDILLDNTHYDLIWAPSTPVTYGQKVVPTVRNGHMYFCVRAGTTGTVEPTWLSFLDYVNTTESGYSYALNYLRVRNQDVTIADGTALWQEYQPDTIEQFALRGAIHDAWMLKASKCSADFQFATDLQIFHKQQIYEHCVDQAGRYAPQGIT